MFSLCIPTMDRFDKFLKKSLEKYLENPYISEIIVTDENGNDYQKINHSFKNTKIKCFVNQTRLGPFLNKIECCKKASCDWIVLMDSDNFADVTYFQTAENFIKNNTLNKYSILMPSFAKPLWNYNSLSKIFTIDTNKKDIQKKFTDACFNTGNYVLSKNIFIDLDLKQEIPSFSPSDVIYFNTLLFEEFKENITFYRVEKLEYDHATHDGSIYIQNHQKYKEFETQIHHRFYSLFKI